MRTDRVEPIMVIRKEVRFPKREPYFRVDRDEDSLDDSIKKYVDIAKNCPIDKEALEMLLRIELGDDITNQIKIFYK